MFSLTDFENFEILYEFYVQTGHLCHVLGDAHVYVNHVDALQEQVDFDYFRFLLCILFRVEFSVIYFAAQTSTATVSYCSICWKYQNNR